MDRKIVLTKTAKGLMEAAGKTSFVGREARNVLTHVDGKATIGDLQTKLNLAERKLDTHLGALMRQGLVREFVVAPLSITPPSQMSALGHTIDFSALLPRDMSQEARQQHAEAEAIAREIAAAAAAREERAAAALAPVAQAESDVKAEAEVKNEEAAPEVVDPFAAFRMRADLTLREAEQRVHAEAEKARMELRAKAEREREVVERNRKEAEAQALRAETERRQREERQAQKQAVEKAKQEGHAQARRAIEEQTRRAEDELKRREVEEQMRKAAAEEKLRQEAAEKARKEAAEKARREAIAAAEAQARAQSAAEMGIEIEIETPPEVVSIPEPSPPVQRGGDTLPRHAADIEARKGQEEVRRKVREEERAKAKAQAEVAARMRKEERAREVAEAEARALARSKERERDTALIASRLQTIRHRRGINVGARSGLALVLILVLGLLLLPYMPVDATRYETLASARLGQSVKIGEVAYVPYPLPHLRFDEVRVGTVEIAEVRARPQWTTLWSEAPVFEQLELRGVRAQPSLLGNLLWGRMRVDAVMPALVKLEGLQLEGLDLPALRGTMNIDAAGRRMLDLGNEAGDASIHLTRQGEEAVFEMHAKATRGILPMPLSLQDLNVRGIVGARGVQISAFDARLYDGVIKGSGSLTQAGQWQLQTKIEATQLDVRQFVPALDGRLRGEGQLQLGGERWQELAVTNKLSGSFEIEKGQLNDIDLVRSLREGHFATGKTPFAALRGQAALEKDKISLRALQMDAGLLKATGTAEFTPKGLSGRLNADMRSSAAGTLRGNFALSGTPSQIKLQPLP